MALVAEIIARNTRALQPLATTVDVGALYYVTDEGALERSNGAIWESYSTSPAGGVRRGTRALQPAAATVAVGVLYYVTDEYVLERSTGAVWQSYSESPVLFDAGNSGAALTLDWKNGRKQRLVLTGACTLTLSNPTDGARHVIVIHTGAGGFTVSWPAAVLWSGAVSPTITAGAAKTDLVVLLWDATAARYYGAISQNYPI